MHTPARWLAASILVAASALAAPALARAQQVSARLEPDTVAPGEAATLTISVEGDAAASGVPAIPDAADLDVQSVGQQTSMNILNGVVERSVAYIYSVRASHVGDVSIAGIRVGDAQAPTLTLHVVAGAQSGSNAAPLPPSAAATPNRQADMPADLAFMRLHVDKQRLYTGQSVPFTVQAYFRGGTGVAVKGRPELSSDAFTVSGLDDSPSQQQTSLNGVPYLAVTWRGSLTAVKSGDHALDMSMPVSLQYRETGRAQSAQPRGQSLRDLFGGHSPLSGLMQDPFFDSLLDQPMFDGFVEPGRLVSRDITLHGRGGQAHVLPLPDRDKPADFTGAIGQFDVQAKLTDQNLTRGEPVDLHFAISGHGNFGQFTSPGLEQTPRWKAYAAHDTFKPNDKLGLSGTANYVQPIAAQSGGELSLPGLHFSYFDPDAQRYVTKTTPAIAVHVAQPVPDDTLAQSTATSRAAAAAPAGLTDELSVQSLEQGGIPGWLLPAGSAALLLALAACGFALWRRSSLRELHARRSRAAKLVAQQRRAMRRAALDGDRLAYLRSGRRAFQQSLGAAWGVAPDSITTHELDERWPSAPDTIRRVFELADQAEYAGGRLQPTPELGDLGAWSDRVDRQIKHMEVPS